MPNNNGNVGPQVMPVPAGAVDAAFSDPLAFTLAHYLAHWLNFDLSPKLKRMRPYKTEAVPVDRNGIPKNVATLDPGTTFVRNPLPAIYCWCPKSKGKQWTQIQELRVAEYHVRYYFQPLTVPKGANSWSGLLQGVDRAFHQAAQDWRHQTFPPTGLTLPVPFAQNCSIERALCLRQATLDRIMTGMTWESPGQSTSGAAIRPSLGSGNDGASQRGFPTVHAVFMIEEFVNQGQPDVQADETPDIPLEIRGASEGSVATDLMTRVLQAPDGTDSLSQKDEF